MATEPVRLDKWLWAARFFKTRGLAAEAIDAGHVQRDGSRVKASRAVGVGDSLRIRKGDVEWVVVVRAVADVRRPAAEAVELYEESAASREARDAAEATRALERAARRGRQGRPTKRERREGERRRRGEA